MALLALIYHWSGAVLGNAEIILQAAWAADDIAILFLICCSFNIIGQTRKWESAVSFP